MSNTPRWNGWNGWNGWNASLVALAVGLVACVHVPDSIKQEFRAAEPDERSNYQPGLHGTAPAADASDPWSRHGFALADAGVQADAAADADAPGPDSPGPAVVMPAPPPTMPPLPAASVEPAPTVPGADGGLR